MDALVAYQSDSESEAHPQHAFKTQDSANMHAVDRRKDDDDSVGDDDDDDEDEDDDDDDISILPHDEVTKLSTVLKRSQKDTSHANATPESIAQSMEAMSISPYTG